MKPTVTLNVKKSNYAAVLNLLNRVIVGLTGNLNFGPPNSPLLATLSADEVALSAAIAQWGPEGNRGSHADLLALQDACNTAYNHLIAEAADVQSKAQVLFPNDYIAQAAAMNGSGFSVKNAPVPQGALGAPQNLHRMFADTVSLYTPKLKWKKPLGLTSPNNVKSYQIIRNTVNNILTGTVIATATKTSFVDTTALAGTAYWYWVKGVNTAGTGAESNLLATSTPV